ncbi:chromatin remodelling complex Rsc7/Swp82 subunit domain-containing protein [Trichoderma ceciliae]
MLGRECAIALGYRDSHTLFRNNKDLCCIIANSADKDWLVSADIILSSDRSQTIYLVMARIVFRLFGHRVIVNGHRVRDDYWEAKARREEFAEADPADKRSSPGEAVAKASQNSALLDSSTHPAQLGRISQPQRIRAPTGSLTGVPTTALESEHDNTRLSRNYSNNFNPAVLQETTNPLYGPPYGGMMRRSRPILEPVQFGQAHHVYDSSRISNQQRSDLTQYSFSRPHRRPLSSSLAHPVDSGEIAVPIGQATTSSNGAVIEQRESDPATYQSP